MTNESELPFRITCVAFGVLAWTVRLAFERGTKSPPVVRSVQTRRERLSYRLVVAGFLFAFVYGLTPLIDFAHLPIPAVVRWTLGTLLSALAVGLYVWTHRTLGRNWSGILEVREGHRLVTDGPYRWVRHPMYSVFFIFCFAQLVISANALVGLIGLSALSYFYLRRVKDEEAMMLEQFGDAYRQYMGRTGRLVPLVMRPPAR
jgi:protein-S-isoprenylcysteine O-methyltransferase Ste14